MCYYKVGFIVLLNNSLHLVLNVSFCASISVICSNGIIAYGFLLKHLKSEQQTETNTNNQMMNYDFICIYFD